MVLQLPVVPNFLGSSDLTENLPGYMYMARKQSLRIWAKSETKNFRPKKHQSGGLLRLPVLPKLSGWSDLTENLSGYMYMAR